MIELKFMGSAELVRDEMARMLGLRRRDDAPMPTGAGTVVNVAHFMPNGEPADAAQVLNADTAAALDTPIDAPQSAQDAPESKGGETAAEAAEEAESGPADGQQTSFVAADAAPPSPKGKADGEPEITLVQARERMNGLRQKYGAKAVRQVLDQMQVPKFTDVPEDRYPELMVLCDAMEKGMENA